MMTVASECAPLPDAPMYVVCGQLNAKLYPNKLVNGCSQFFFFFHWWQFSHISLWIREVCRTSCGKKLEENHPRCWKSYWKRSCSEKTKTRCSLSSVEVSLL